MPNVSLGGSPITLPRAHTSLMVVARRIYLSMAYYVYINPR